MGERKTRGPFLALVVLLLVGCGGGETSGDGAAAGPAGPAFDAATATATLTGEVLFAGAPPEMPELQMRADPYCDQSGAGTRSPEVLVTGDGRLQNVIVYLRSGYDAGLAYPPPAAAVLLDQQNCMYTPHVVTIMTGQTMTVRNSDRTVHNVRARPAANRPFNFGQPVQGFETTQSFAAAEMPITVQCDVHRWMNAVIAVFDHPFHTTSGDSGRFSLNVPPGTYEVVAWHERYGEQVSTVTVADNATAAVAFTFSAD